MADKKKVLILADINSIHTQKWVKSLMCDFDIFLCSIDPITEITHEIEEIVSFVKFYTSQKRLSNSSNKLLFLKFYLQLIRIKKSFKPDIIHSHYATSYGLLGRLLFFKRFYISVWGSDIFEFPLKSTLHRIIIRFILQGAATLFSTSKTMLFFLCLHGRLSQATAFPIPASPSYAMQPPCPRHTSPQPRSLLSPYSYCCVFLHRTFFYKL